MIGLSAFTDLPAMVKIIPVVLLAAALGYGAHLFIVSRLEETISEQKILIADRDMQLNQYQVKNSLLVAAAQTNQNTIDTLVQSAGKQREQVTALTLANQKAEQEKQQYMEIFKSHNLSKLATDKPGLIEPLLNTGTQKVFDQVMQDSKEAVAPQ